MRAKITHSLPWKVTLVSKAPGAYSNELSLEQAYFAWMWSVSVVASTKKTSDGCDSLRDDNSVRFTTFHPVF